MYKVVKCFPGSSGPKPMGVIERSLMFTVLGVPNRAAHRRRDAAACCAQCFGWGIVDLKSALMF